MTCVLTLALDEASQAWFERLRRAWFPPALNRIPAHLTLFHTLPRTKETRAALVACAKHHQGFTMLTEAPRLIGRGVAYFFRSREAAAVHAELRRTFEQHLSDQDLQRLRPHIVVQNKVSQQEAKAALAALQQEAMPAAVTGVGLDLWLYRDGPWKHLRRFAFQQGVS